MRRDIIAGALLLGIVAVFWVQRDFSGQLTAAFPEFVLAVMALLAVVIIVRGVVRGDRSREKRTIDLRYLAAAVVLLLGWGLGMGLIGFTITGVVGFVVMAQMIKRSRPSPRSVLLDTAVGVVVVVGCFYIFTRGLLVPLPVSVLIGM